MRKKMKSHQNHMELDQFQNFTPNFLLAVKFHPCLSMYCHFMFSHSGSVKRVTGLSPVQIYLFRFNKTGKTKYQIYSEF